MKAPNKELRKFVYDRLLNSITVGSIIPVCSVPKKDQAFPFIDLGNISCLDTGAKDHNILRAQFEINVYSQFADENISYSQVEDISTHILERLVDYLGETINFKIEWCHFISSQENFEQTETVKAISNQIILEFLIEEI
jgi:hypothetical protein